MAWATLQEAADVGAVDVVARAAELARIVNAGPVDAGHGFLEAVVDLGLKVQLEREAFCCISRADTATPPALAAFPGP
jgi:molybdate-binding protein